MLINISAKQPKLTTQGLGKEEQTKARVSRRQEITKIRAAINEKSAK